MDDATQMFLNWVNTIGGGQAAARSFNDTVRQQQADVQQPVEQQDVSDYRFRKATAYNSEDAEFEIVFMP